MNMGKSASIPATAETNGTNQQENISKVKKRSREETAEYMKMGMLSGLLQKKKKLTLDPMQLSGLNDDCLMTIFEYLDVTDLMNMAESNERFINSIQSVFNRRHRNKKFCIFSGLFDIITLNDRIVIDKNNAAAFIRQFGQFTSQMSINFVNHDVNDTEIERSFLAECTETLNKLHLICCREENFEIINEPFKNVTELTIMRSTLSSKLSELNKWFPNLIRLELLNTQLSDTKMLTLNFPQLKQLCIKNEYDTMKLTTINELLSNNLYLETLCLECDTDIDLLETIGTKMKRLDELILYSASDRFYSFGDDIITIENVQKFTLINPLAHGEFVVNMPFKFPALKELNLIGFNEFKGPILHFISEHKELKKLSLKSFIEDYDDLDFDDLTTVIKSMPDLKHLEFCGDLFTNAEITKMLIDNNGLKTVLIYMIDYSDYIIQLQKSLESKWKITLKPIRYSPFFQQTYFIKLERKNKEEEN